MKIKESVLNGKVLMPQIHQPMLPYDLLLCDNSPIRLIYARTLEGCGWGIFFKKNVLKTGGGEGYFKNVSLSKD